jgi:cellulose biosynthesis protein BcsQ
MRSICFFNNKGGVGKTTLTCNIAAHFAERYGQRVLILDADPQCNATQLVLGDERIAEYYSPVANGMHYDTVLDVVQPILDGDAAIHEAVTPARATDNRFHVDILPGHPRFSVIEDRLSQAWYDAIGGDIGGIRKSNWCYAFLQSIGHKYDVVFMDLGPSLGSINRSVLLASDYFVTPLGADVFSLLGIRNIADWFGQWKDLYSTGLQLCEQRHPDRLRQYAVQQELPVASGFVGYTMQQYITKSKAGVRRPTDAFEHILRNVPNEVAGSLGGYLRPELNLDRAQLGDVPNMFSLIPLAQSVNAPIRGLAYKDGLVGSQYRQAADYARILDRVAENIAVNIGLEGN